MNWSLAETQDRIAGLVEAGAIKPTPDGVHWWLTLNNFPEDRP